MTTLAAKSLDSLVREAIRNVFKRELKKGDIAPALTEAEATALWKGCASGLGVKYDDFADNELATALRSNIYVFACFKNHAQIADMVSLLMDAQGKVRKWTEYRALALQVSQKYNVEWLKAEYDTALASGRMAARWSDIIRDAGTNDMLTYETVGDKRVRQSHALLDGVTLPITDDFWNDYYPPNGWKCRCTVRQSSGPARKPTSLPSDDEVPVAFRNNVGKSGKVFTDEHPYFKTAKPDVADRLRKAAQKMADQ